MLKLFRELSKSITNKNSSHEAMVSFIHERPGSDRLGGFTLVNYLLGLLSYTRKIDIQNLECFIII